MKWSSYLFSICFACVLLFEAPAVSAKQLGVVQFPITCSQKSQKEFNDALALTHHMMYIQAEDKFNKIVKNDPKCAMGYWGIALTQTHPLWSEKPSATALKKGFLALKKAKSLLQPSNKRELAYVNALEPLYTNWKSVPYKKRLIAWEKAQHLLYKKFPKDPDAIALYALAHLAIAPKADKTFKHQMAAGKILEAMHQKNPSHPGGFHYTIHAYDNPKLAKKAEKIARGYDKIAPDVPHALHMPSHIFVRLGLWPETIQWNIRSAAVAKRQSLKGGVMSMHYAHAMDYLMYSYLQEGQDKKAAKILKKVNAVKKYQSSLSTAYGVAAARARFYLEQRLWKKAANLPLGKPKSFPWKKYPAAESITYFARGIGAVKTGDIQKTNLSIRKLNKFNAILRKRNKKYWAVLVKSKEATLLAWLEYSKGHKTKALRLMKISANLEDSVDKHPITPSEVLPARELLGNMLLKLDKPKKALVAYQATLKISPNRLNSVYGAGLSAEKADEVKLAKKYYQQLVKLTKKADTQLAEISHAKKYLKAH